MNKPAPSLYSPNNANALYARLLQSKAQAGTYTLALGLHLKGLRKAMTRPQWAAFKAKLDLADKDVAKFIKSADGHV